MKIGTPVKDIPPRQLGIDLPRWGKYSEVWKAVLGLPNGDWLPVECDSAKEARNIYYAAHTHRTLPLTAKCNGKTAYVKLR